MFALKRMIILTLSMLVLSAASGQELARLLPADTVFALGIEDLQGVSAEIEDFRAEFERLELTEALTALFGGIDELDDATEGLSEEAERLQAPLEGLATNDLIGQEAWISISISATNPLPVVTLVTRLSGDALPAARDLLAESNYEAERREGDYTFYEMIVEDPDVPTQILAYSLADDVLALSSNPDALRGVLRRLSGANEPNFVSSQGYESTLGQLSSGNLYGYLDYAQVASSLQPLGQGLGFDAAINRLAQAFNTAGTSAGVVRVTSDGLVSEGFQAVNADGGDLVLYNLLTGALPASRGSSDLAPEDALSYTSSYIDLSAWWNYLNDLSASVPELGGDLDSLLGEFLGVDLQRSFFSWAGEQVTLLTTGFGDVVEPGMPSDNLLGEFTYAIESTDESAANAGLRELFQVISMTGAMFGDPSGQGGQAQTTTEEIAGVTVTTHTITEGLSLSHAVSGGYAFIATSRDSIHEVLSAQAGERGRLLDRGTFRSLKDEVPQDAISFTISDSRATIEGTSQQIISQLQFAAGLGGAGQLDFEAVEQASSAVEEFMQFVASRLGGGVSYSETRDSGIYSYGKTEVSW